MPDTINKPTSFMIPVTTEVSIQRVSDLLCSAFEGGSNYWYMIEEAIKPINFNNSDEGTTEENCIRHLDYPINEGGAIIISDIEDEDDEEPTKYTLNLSTIESGLQIMAQDYASHFHDFMQGDDDASTGDVFLQCCLFGEVVFG